ncbi:MAG: S41 family peptidase [Chloroflexi bacterium]|nr:MAG: S41 family peptidase [Chloroflexota bacterium]
MQSSLRILRPLAVICLFSLAACTPAGGGSSSGNRIVTPAPAAKPSGARTTPTPVDTSAPAAASPASSASTSARLRGESLSSTDLYTAYRAILETYVDPVDNTQLIRAAADGLRQGLQENPTLPLLTLPLQLAGATTGDADKDWQGFGDAYDSVVTKMPDWAQQTHPDWTVLRSMADSLHDGHTSFMTPDEAKRRNETSFAGIGVLMSRPQDNQPPLIAEIFPNSPAASSGLKRGDRIIAVDGQDVSGRAVGDIATLIRGQPGTQVRVQVSRLGTPDPLEFTMKRALVQVEQVIGRQVPNAPIGYLKIRSFGDASTVDQVLGILDQGRQRGLKGWVIDLRGNPGGSLNAVIGAAGGFFDANHAVIGYQVDRQRRQTPLQTQPLNLLNGAALVVLVDRESASGAEIFAAALQEAQIATLVGSKTAGNVGVATQITLPDDSVLQVTEQRFVSPGGAQLDGVGVTPDVQVDMTDEDLQNDRDPQLGKALELIVQKITSSPGG